MRGVAIYFQKHVLLAPRGPQAILQGILLPYREGPHMRSLISIDFPAPKWNLKAHMRYQLSPFTGSNVAIAMQHDPGNIQHQDKSFSSWLATATLSP